MSIHDISQIIYINIVVRNTQTCKLRHFKSADMAYFVFLLIESEHHIPFSSFNAHVLYLWPLLINNTAGDTNDKCDTCPFGEGGRERGGGQDLSMTIAANFQSPTTTSSSSLSRSLFVRNLISCLFHFTETCIKSTS